MIRTRAASFFALTLSSALLLSMLNAHALGQGLPSVPNDVKSAGDVGASRPQIETFITQAVAQLGNESADLQKTARDALQKEAQINGQPTASPAYLNLYTQLLNQQLVNLAQNPNMRVRLNAAIVTYSVAKVASNPNLIPAAIAFMNDKSQAVVLWGVKAGRPLVPAQLRVIGGAGPQLAPAIVAAVTKHPKGMVGGAIAVDAYDALTMDVTTPASAKNLTPQMLQAVIPFVQDLMKFRVGQFTRGVPPEPGADRTGASFLVHPAVMPLQTPAQQAVTMQLLSDLLSLAADQAVAANATDQAYLLRIVQHIATSISVAASNAGEAGIVQAVTPVAQPPNRVGAKQIAALVKAVHPAIKGSKKFASTNAPPSVTGHEAPPPPASAPTSGPVAIPGASALPIAAPGGGAATRPTTRPAGAPPAGTSSGARPTAPPPATPPARK